MSDQGPRMINVGGRLFGPTPEPPSHLRDIDSGAADAAWRQSNGSIAAYYMLLDEHAAGKINLLSKDQTRLTGPDHVEVAGGDKRLSATGGEVYSAPVIEAEPAATAVAGKMVELQPLTVAERDRLAALRAMPEAELTQPMHDEMANLIVREADIGR